MKKSFGLNHDKITALIESGKIPAGVKYVGNLPVCLTIVKNSFGKLIKGTEDWEFHPVLKSGKVYETLTAGAALKMYPEHNFGVGDSFYNGAEQSTISAIVVGAPLGLDYDVFTIASTTISANTVITQEQFPETEYFNYKNIVAVGTDFDYTETQRIEGNQWVYVIANKTFDFYLLPNYLSELSVVPQIGSLTILPLMLGSIIVENNTFNRDNLNLLGYGSVDNVFGDDSVYNRLGILTDGNQFGAECSNNKLGDHCESNIFGYQSVGNELGNNCNSNQFGEQCTNNNIGNDIVALVVGNGFTLNTIESNIDFTGIDFTSATHVYADYHCRVFKDAAEVVKLSYIDASGVLQVVAPNA